jgi:hypothetical protein
MTRKRPNHLLGILILITVVVAIITPCTVAQMPIGQTLKKAPSVATPLYAVDSTQTAERRTLPGGRNAVPAVSRSGAEQNGANPMAENPPLFVLAGILDSGGQGATGVTIGDLNGDGHPDVVVANQYPGTVDVLLGKGDGTFQSPVDYSSGPWPATSWSVAIGDVNGDGHPDLVVGNFTGPTDGIHWGSVGVLLGNGDGTFKPAVTYKPGGCGTFSVAIGDVNSDGKPDIAVANWFGALASCGGLYGIVGILLGNGDGTFQAPVSYSSGGYQAYSVAIADVNSDGNPDLLVANNCQAYANCATGSVSVLLGNGDGLFNTAVSYSAGASGTDAVAVSDVNNDRRLDLILANGCTGFDQCNTGSLSVLLGNGDGSFQPSVVYGSGGAKAFSVAIGDVNADGHRDLVTANTNSNSVGVLLGNNDGTFQPAVTFDSGGFADFSVSMADLNMNGRPDIVVANDCAQYCANGHAEGAVGVLLNNPAVGKSTTSTSLTSSLNPSIYGQSVTWTATVTSSGSVTPTGKVRFTWSGYTIGSATLNNGGVATLSRSNLNADPYPLTSVYAGDSANLGSTSVVLNQVVLQTTTSATLTSTPNPSASGQAVTFTATITSPTVMPTGPVTFAVGKTVLGTAQLSGGKAKFTISALAVGSTKVTATYYGNSNIAKSSASVTQTVHQ